MSEARHPARSALRIGITGHRPEKLAGFDPDQLRRSLARVLERIDASARSHGLPGGAAPALRLVSALAEGADRMAVEVAPTGWALDALLPMPRADYEQDFLAPGDATSASVEAFRAMLVRADTIIELPALAHDLSGPGPRTAQYAALGHALVGNVDLLVAIWDGKAAAGPGGTARVVAEAEAAGVPFILIAPDGSAETLEDAVWDRLLAGVLDTGGHGTGGEATASDPATIAEARAVT